MMPEKLSSASEALIKKLFKTSQQKGKDLWVPDINQKGNSLFNACKYNDSLEYYQLSADLSPAEPGVWNNLGNNYLMLNNLPKAFDCFQKVISIDKNDFNSLVNLGNCYITWNQADLAVEYYLRASIVNQKSIIPLKSLAHIYKKKQKFNQSLIYFEKCLLIDPKNIQILMDIAVISLFQNQIGKGVQCLKKVLKMDPTNGMAQVLLFKLQEENKL